MSLIIAGKTADALIVASDRRITSTFIENNIEKNTPKTSNEQKTFLVQSKFSVSYCGNANINGIPTSSYLRHLFTKLPPISSTHELAGLIADRLKNDGITNPPSLLISGYNDNAPSILEVKSPSGDVVVHQKDDDTYGIVYHGDTKIAKALIESGDFSYSLMRPGDMCQLFNVLIQTTAKIQGLQKTIQSVSEEYDLLIITPKQASWITKPFMEEYY